jgi:hypothetical protein
MRMVDAGLDAINNAEWVRSPIYVVPQIYKVYTSSAIFGVDMAR